jgi:hypothetical protein
MSNSGSARLNYTLKTLRERWDIAKEKWSDIVSRDFEQKHIVPLEQQTRTAVRGMEKIGEVMGKIRADLGRDD